MSFLKRIIRPNGRSSAISSVTGTSRLPTGTEVMSKAGRSWDRWNREIISSSASQVCTAFVCMRGNGSADGRVRLAIQRSGAIRSS